MGLGETEGKFFLDSVTSVGHSSSEGKPMTLKLQMVLFKKYFTQSTPNTKKCDETYWDSLDNLPKLVHFRFPTEQRSNRHKHCYKSEEWSGVFFSFFLTENHSDNMAPYNVQCRGFASRWSQCAFDLTRGWSKKKSNNPSFSLLLFNTKYISISVECM